MIQVCYYLGCGDVYGEKKPLSDKKGNTWAMPNAL